MPFPEELVYCYGDSEPIALDPGTSATLNGTLTVAVDNASFAELADDALHYTVTGCAVNSDADGTSAQGLYEEYLSAGGE